MTVVPVSLLPTSIHPRYFREIKSGSPPSTQDGDWWRFSRLSGGHQANGIILGPTVYTPWPDFLAMGQGGNQSPINGGGWTWQAGGDVTLRGNQFGFKYAWESSHTEFPILLQYFTFDEPAPTDVALYYALCVTSTGYIRLRWYGWTSDGIIATDSTLQLSENTEYSIKVLVQSGTGSGTTDYVKVYVNGALLLDESIQFGYTGSQPVGVTLGPTTGPFQGNPYVTTWFKNIVASTGGLFTAPVLMKILPVLGAGTYQQHTGSYADVDDFPPDADTTEIYASSPGTRTSSFTLDTSQLDANDTIHAVELVSHGRYVASVGGHVPLLYDGQVWTWPSDVTNTSNNVYTGSWNTIGLVFLENPATSAPWQVSDLSNFEIGVRTYYSSDIRVTSVYAVVLYSPPALSIDLDDIPVLSFGVPELLITSGIALNPVVLRHVVEQLGVTLSAISPEPVVLHTRTPSVALVKERFTLPTARGQWWTVGTTPPLVVREGYVWVDTSNPGSPVIYQYIDNVWVDTLGGYTEAVTREVMDGGGSSSAGALTTIVNLTGLNIPASKHIVIDAFFTNTNGAGQVSAVELQLNGVAVMSGVAMPGTGTGEIGTWRIIIPRRDKGDLGGRSYLVVPPDTQTVTTLTSVPQNAPITSIALRANPNGTAFEIRNVLVRSLLAQ